MDEHASSSSIRSSSKNNHDQACNLISELECELDAARKDLHFVDSDFEKWRVEEEQYLCDRQSAVVPEEEVMEMKYAETLQRLESA